MCVPKHSCSHVCSSALYYLSQYNLSSWLVQSQISGVVANRSTSDVGRFRIIANNTWKILIILRHYYFKIIFSSLLFFHPFFPVCSFLSWDRKQNKRFCHKTPLSFFSFSLSEKKKLKLLHLSRIYKSSMFVLKFLQEKRTSFQKPQLKRPNTTAFKNCPSQHLYVCVRVCFWKWRREIKAPGQPSYTVKSSRSS